MKSSKTLVLGFLPEADCAPIVVAQEFGLYRKYGLEVELQREQSWCAIQDGITQRKLQAGHAPASLPFLMNIGLTPEKCASVTGLVLSLQGNGIVLSRDLWNQGVRDADTFGQFVMGDKRAYTFGVGCPLGPQYSLLCQWLRAAEIPYRVKIRIELAAPHEMFPLLKMGYLDGYCVGEPWTSLAAQAGVGVCVASSAHLAPLHPEKVLLVRKEFAEKRRDEHERLIAALIEACAICDQLDQRKSLCDLLAKPQFVNAPVECLAASFVEQPSVPAEAPTSQSHRRLPKTDRSHSGKRNQRLSVFPDSAPAIPGATVLHRSENKLHGAGIFSRNRANDPTAAKATWVTGQLYSFLRWGPRPAGLHNVFRRSIYLRAQSIVNRWPNRTSQDQELASAG